MNHLHRVFLLPISNFQRPQDAQPSPKGGVSLNKRFGRYYPAEIAKHVHVCIACQFAKKTRKKQGFGKVMARFAPYNGNHERRKPYDDYYN